MLGQLSNKSDTPSKSASDSPKAHPFASTLDPDGVLGHWSESLGTPSLSSSSISPEFSPTKDSNTVLFV